jgi:membrane fusion protein (multidrug efflux system)
MRNLFLLLLTAAILVACSAKDAPQGAGGKPAKGGRTLSVEGYVAEFSKPKREFQTMATLEANNSVSLSAAVSGRLVELHAKDGASVPAGMLLAKLDDAELRAQLKQAESNLLLASQREQRTRALYQQGGMTQEDLEAAVANLQSAEASVEYIKAQIEKTEVRAPFAGKLGLVNISVGQWLNAGAPVAELSDVKKLKARFAVRRRYAASVKVGDRGTLKGQERNVEKKGKVTALDATISESSRTRQVVVTVDNSSGKLIAGGYASITLQMKTAQKSSTTIPAEALILDRDGAYVFVVKDGKAHVKHVKTGLRTPFSVEIVSGLSKGDTVIVSGIISLREGVPVNIKDIRHGMNYEVD